MKMVSFLASVLGISATTAYKVIELALAGASIWAIVAAVACGGGIIAIGTAVLRAMVKQYGKRVGESVALGIVAGW